jgi:hypothetical protein
MMASARSAGVRAGAQFDTVARNRRMGSPCLLILMVRERGAGQVYDDCDENVVGARCCIATPLCAQWTI